MMGLLKRKGAYICVLIISLLVIACLAGLTFGTGTNGNEPATGFSEGAEKIEIFNHTTGVYDTEFDMDENITLRVTSSSITSLPAGNKNEIKVKDYLGVEILKIQDFFLLDSAGPPIVMNGTFAASAANGFTEAGDYLLLVKLEMDKDHKFIFSEVIHIGGSYLPEERYIKLFSDSAYTSESYLFDPSETIYVEMWSGSIQPTNADSTVELIDYTGWKSGKININTLSNGIITLVGNYSRFAVSVPLDLGGVAVLADNYWYTLSTTLKNGKDHLIKDWAVQFKINYTGMANPPAVVAGDTQALPSPILAGTGSTLVHTNFTHPDSPAVDTLAVTFKVRSDTNVETILVNASTNGQNGLTVTQDGTDSTKYLASYTWSPLATQELGTYDLYFMVFDGVQIAVDGYGDNEDELVLLDSTLGFPQMNLSATMAYPSTVVVWGPNTTTISVDFNHTDAPDPTTFKITFRVRDPQNNPPIVLVDAATHGNQGVNVTKTGTNNYTATYVWNPPDTALLGRYDLFSRVEDANGMFAEDDFGANADELVLVNLTAEIKVTAGDTIADPDLINRTGNEETTISCKFYHNLAPIVEVFKVSFLVRDPDGTAYTLAQEKKHGTGNVNVVSLGDKNFSASYVWDPPEDQPIGTYDLYFEVEDAFGYKAIDTYDNNLEELTIERHSSEPGFTKGDLTAIPDKINVLNKGTTLLTMPFFHGELPEVDTFEVTYTVRDVNDTEYILVDKGSNGDPNLEVTTDGLGNFTTAFTWTPSKDQNLSTYDLQVKITDSGNRELEDVFADNLEELTLVAESVGPEDKNGTIEGSVKDKDNKTIPGATITVYDSEGNEVTTVTADENGNFELKLPPGTYDVTVDANGYLSKIENDLVVEEGGLLDLDIELEKDPAADDDDDDDDVSGLMVAGIIFFIILALVVIVIIIFLMMRKKEEEGEEEEEEEEEEEKLPPPPPDDEESEDDPLLSSIEISGMSEEETEMPEPGDDELMEPDLGMEEEPSPIEDIEEMEAPDMDEEVPDMEDSLPDEQGAEEAPEMDPIEKSKDHPKKKK